MREIQNDLWHVAADYYVITTNGDVRKDGAAVMGRGVALQAKQRHPDIEYVLGRKLQIRGNHVILIVGSIISFPVKHHWRERADTMLIERSAMELKALIDLQRIPIRTVAMPRPGCGNGKLDWHTVKPIISSILDDRFLIVNND